MSVRFVEFKIAGGDEILINPANVCWVQQQRHINGIAVCTSDSERPTYVIGTLEEVLAKLQGASDSPKVVDNGGGLCQFDIP